MAASSSLPLAVLFLLVLVASAVPATAAGGKYSGARMVIISGPAATTRVAGADGARSNEWQQHYRRLVEDEVAPAELGGLLLGAGDGRLGNHVLNPDNTGCERSSQCAAKGRGGSYTRPCTYSNYCAH